MPPQTRPRKSLLYKKEELVLSPPVRGFVKHIFNKTILPSHQTA
jgi:hypothetical protein